MDKIWIKGHGKTWSNRMGTIYLSWWLLEKLRPGFSTSGYSSIFRSLWIILNQKSTPTEVDEKILFLKPLEEKI